MTHWDIDKLQEKFGRQMPALLLGLGLLTGVMILVAFGIDTSYQKTPDFTLGDIQKPDFNIQLRHSPNFTKRSSELVPDTIVLYTVNQAEYSELLRKYNSARSRNSVHFSVSPKGYVFEHVDLYFKAFFAQGKISPFNRNFVDEYSVAIVMILNKVKHAYTYSPQQLLALHQLLKHIDQTYKIKHILYENELIAASAEHPAEHWTALPPLPQGSIGKFAELLESNRKIVPDQTVVEKK